MGLGRARHIHVRIRREPGWYLACPLFSRPAASDRFSAEAWTAGLPAANQLQRYRQIVASRSKQIGWRPDLWQCGWRDRPAGLDGRWSCRGAVNLLTGAGSQPAGRWQSRSHTKASLDCAPPWVSHWLKLQVAGADGNVTRWKFGKLTVVCRLIHTRFCV